MDPLLTNLSLNTTQQTNKSELWNLSIKDLFYKYVRFLPLFLLSIAVALLVAFAYLRYTTRIYAAGGSLLIKSEQTSKSADKVEDLITANSRSQNIQNEVELLKSRPLMARVVRKLNLQFGYSAKGKIIKDLNVYTQGPFLIERVGGADTAYGYSINIKFNDKNTFRVNGSDKTYQFGQDFPTDHGNFRLIRQYDAEPASEFKVSWNAAENVASGIVQGLRVVPKSGGTGILAISLQSTNGQMAADIVNKLMVEYDSLTIEQNNYSTDQMVSFIDGRLDKLKLEVDSIKLIELKLRQRDNLFDVDAQSTDFLEKMKETDKAVVEQEFRIESVNNVEKYTKDKQNQYSRVVPSSLGLDDITLNELVGGYNKAQMERQLMIDANIPVNNPRVKQAEKVIEKQRENLLESLRLLRSDYLDRISSLQKRSIGDQANLQTLPYKIKELVEIQRQINTKLALYNLLEQKREEAAISRAATISSSTIIDKAGASNVPIAPNRRAVQIIAILVGLGLPALFIFLSEVLNDKISTRYDIEKLTNAAIMGEIGHSYQDKVMIVDSTSRSMVSEQFRIIRSNLQYVLAKATNQVIMVTSSFSGEGKSYISTNMGAVMALTGKKTIILEFDIRKPKVLSGLGMSKRQGISNYLVGKATVDDLITKVPETENLYVFPCGPIPPNPAELLLDEKVSQLFAELKQRFDVIIVDTAPVGMVSDSMTLGKFADCTLYIVRQGHTFKKQIALIDELYRESKLPKISIVINDVKLKPGYGYYGYGRYGYGYGYGQGKNTYYTEDIPTQTKFEKFLSLFRVSKKSIKKDNSI